MLNERPYFKDFIYVTGITIVLTIVIYIINIVLGDGANFWFLWVLGGQHIQSQNVARVCGQVRFYQRLPQQARRGSLPRVQVQAALGPTLY